MPIAWYPKRWWNFCVPEDEEKRNRTEHYWGVVKVYVSSIQYGGTETFWDKIVYEFSYLIFFIKIFKSI